MHAEKDEKPQKRMPPAPSIHLGEVIKITNININKLQDANIFSKCIALPIITVIEWQQ